VLDSELEEGAEGNAFRAVPLPTEEGPEGRLAQAERNALLRGLIAQLKEEQQEALLLHYADGLSHVEIAVVMERSVAAVNSLLQRARAAIYREGRDYFGAEKEVIHHGTV
jgi:RNA polymerase sigma factor (sigma-70 family)